MTDCKWPDAGGSCQIGNEPAHCLQCLTVENPPELAPTAAERIQFIHETSAVDWLETCNTTFDLIVTDPPYAFGNTATEHAISASVAITLREAARRLKKGRWMLVMCAASWRSTAYMVESVRGIVEPVRIGTWCKPKARTKVDTEGWKWASVNVIAFRKGKADSLAECFVLDHITAEPVMNGRRAQLPPEVADWMVAPYAVPGGLMLDPFAGSGAVLEAAYRAGMHAVGVELQDA